MREGRRKKRRTDWRSSPEEWTTSIVRLTKCPARCGEAGGGAQCQPVERTDPSSPIHGLPILNVDAARSGIVLERSMAAGYSGVENEP